MAIIKKTQLGSTLPITNKRVVRLRRLLLWSPILSVVALILAALAYSQIQPLLSGAHASQDSRVTDMSTDVARQAVDQWIDAGGLPTGAQVIALTDSTSTTSQVSQQGTTSQVTQTTAHFLVVAGKASVDVSVCVTYDATTRAFHVQGSPAVELVAGSVDFKPGDKPWPGTLQSTTVTDAATSAIEAWAGAYFSGSASKLQIATGDTDTTHHYLPMSGATIDPPRVTAAAVISQDKQGTPTTIIASVTVPVSWDEGVTFVDTGFDVRVDAVNSAAPTVTAWGPVGAGPTLTRFHNASTVAVDVGTPEATVAPGASSSTGQPATGSPTPSGDPS